MTEVPQALHRVALSPSDPRGGGRTGVAARGARDRAARVGTGLAAGRGEEGPVDLPAGLWPAIDGEVEVDPVLRANPALAAYAARIRAKRDGGRVPPRRGLPLATRRRLSSAGPETVPGGLARRAVPVDRVEDPEVTAIVRGTRPGTTAALTAADLRGRRTNR